MLKISLHGNTYDDTIFSMQKNNAPWVAPKGMFYLLNDIISPFTPNKTSLNIETESWYAGEILSITVSHIGEYGTGIDVRQITDTYSSVVPSAKFTSSINLCRGKNLITAKIKNEETHLIVSATTIVSLWEAFARVLYNVSGKILNEQSDAISSTMATRLMEPFISFQNLLPSVQSLKTMAFRFLARGLIHSVGTDTGIKDITKALCLSTPIYRKMDKDTFDLFPALDPWTKSASQYAGYEAHVWMTDINIISWLSFLSYISNQPDIFEILSISESEVIFKYYGEIQRHEFTFGKIGTDSLLVQASTECFKSIFIKAFMESEVFVSMCAAAYTFDLFVTEDAAIGNFRKSFDRGFPFDSGLFFDSDPIDPFTDGWVGLSLTGRFEQDMPIRSHPLDTFIAKYPHEGCSYEGWYTQVICNHKVDMDVSLTVSSSGYIQGANAVILKSPGGDSWDMIVDSKTLTIKTVLNNDLPAGIAYKLLKPDLTEAIFTITNEGVIQVTDPVGGEILTETLYIIADDASIWSVSITNDNVIVISKIFID